MSDFGTTELIYFCTRSGCSLIASDIEQKIIRTGKLEDLTSEELESRMKTIIDEYSPILEGVDEKKLKERVLSKPKSQKDS